MINSILKKQVGATTIILTAILLVSATLIVIFAAGYSIMQQKITANQYRSQQAYEAAEAGLEFGIVYLQKNSSTILASPTSGSINPYTSASTTNVVQADSSKFSIVYTNPILSNYTVINISSTGTSADGTATKTVSQILKFSSIFSNPPTVPLTTQGNISLSGNSEITNTANNKTIVTGGSVVISANGMTETSAGTSSTRGNIKSDIQQNQTSISSLSAADYFSTFFGASMNTVKSSATNYYQNSSSTSYNSQLNGKTGSLIWIDQTNGSATLNGNTTVGSPSSPVIIIVNGDFDISGNVTIYGFVFVNGATSATSDITGNVQIKGGFAATDNLNASGNSSLTYSASVMSLLQNQSSISFYAKVPGSWKDF